MQSGLESYAEKLKTRGAVKDVDQSIQEVGGAFSADVTPESVAFEKFLVCAIPDLDKKKDIQGVLEFLAEDCKKDPVPFMTKVRTDCGSLVQNVDKDAKPSPSKTFKANTKKFCRRGSAPAAGLGVLRQALAQGQEGARPRGLPDCRQRLHGGARRAGADRQGEAARISGAAAARARKKKAGAGAECSPPRRVARPPTAPLGRLGVSTIGAGRRAAGLRVRRAIVVRQLR